MVSDFMIASQMFEQRLGEQEEKPIMHCDECGDGIFEGEEYYNFDDEVYCASCVGQFIDRNKRVAERENQDDFV